MEKVNKLIIKWREKAPAEAPWKEVRLVVEAFFTWKWGKGSHVVVESQDIRRIIQEKGYGNHFLPFNYQAEFNVVVHHDTVLGVDVKKVIKAIDILEVVRYLR